MTRHKYLQFMCTLSSNAFWLPPRTQNLLEHHLLMTMELCIKQIYLTIRLRWVDPQDPYALLLDSLANEGLVYSSKPA